MAQDIGGEGRELMGHYILILDKLRYQVGKSSIFAIGINRIQDMKANN